MTPSARPLPLPARRPALLVLLASLTSLAAALPAAASAQQAAAGPAGAEPLLARLASAPDAASAGAARHSGPEAPAPDPAFLAGLRFRYVGPSRGGRVTAVAGHPDRPGVFFMGATGGGVWKTEDRGHTWRNVSDGYFASPSIGAIRMAPSNPDVVYVGTGSDGLRSNVIVGRGVYRSDDGGRSWRHVGLERVGQIGAVEIHPRDPDIAFVAAIGNPFGKSPDRGVYRTRDGGRTWERVLFVSDSTGASDLEFHPTNPDILYAGFWRAERKPWTIISGARGEGGIWKSTDGGSTWRRVTEGLPGSPPAGTADPSATPGSQGTGGSAAGGAGARRPLASGSQGMGGSAAGGAGARRPLASGSQETGGLIGKTDLAVSPAAPDRVYALVEAPDSIEGLYRSDDAGETWRLVSTQNGLMDRPFYYTNVDADPTDADVVWVSATRFWKSEDGGATWERVNSPHGDNHDLWIDPRDPGIMVQSDDGGANITLDGGRSWSTQLNQPTAELYQVDVDDRFPYWLCAGQQDNSTICVPSRPPVSWTPDHAAAWWDQVGGCETGPAVPKPGDPDVVYANCKGRFGRYSRRTGQEQQYYVGAQDMYGHNPRDLKHRFQRVSPIVVSPHDPGVVYHASQYLHRTRDDGKTWERISPDLTANPPERQVYSGEPITRDITGEEFFSTLYAVAESPLVPGVIWTGSNDGVVSVTRDGGANWRTVTPPALPPEARIQTVEASPHDPAEAYVAALRYQLDDWRPYIFRTTDYGRSWTLLTDGSNGIPADWPTRVVREDPVREGLLYAGTEWGAFVSFDEGRRWWPLGRSGAPGADDAPHGDAAGPGAARTGRPFRPGDLPVVPVTDLKVVGTDVVLSTMGRGFWILDDVTPLRELGAASGSPENGSSDAAAGAAPARLFSPPPAFRMRYRSSSWRGRDPAAAEYPPPGAGLYYWLEADVDPGTVRLEVLDSEGRVVRAFAGAAGGEGEGAPPGPADQGMRGPEAPPAPEPELATARGLHRFVWDLEHPGPWSERNGGGGGESGPLAVPGPYRVRLTVGGWSGIRPLEVRADPRVTAEGVTRDDMAAQLALALEVRDLLTEARRLAARLDSARDRLVAAKAAGGGVDPALERLEAVRARLVTSRRGSYPPRMLLDQIEYLYSMITRADQRPGRDAYQRRDELAAELAAVRSEAEGVLEGR